MRQDQHTTTTTTTTTTARSTTARRRRAAVALTTLAVLGLATAPASARQDAGTRSARVGHEGECFLERVGTQLVRCDLLTGEGVPAPSWVPER
jgi:hypothetical protein